VASNEHNMHQQHTRKSLQLVAVISCRLASL
jgi:hypothetical protein